MLHSLQLFGQRVGKIVNIQFPLLGHVVIETVLGWHSFGTFFLRPCFSIRILIKAFKKLWACTRHTHRFLHAHSCWKRIGYSHLHRNSFRLSYRHTKLMILAHFLEKKNEITLNRCNIPCFSQRTSSFKSISFPIFDYSFKIFSPSYSNFIALSSLVSMETNF